MKALVGAFNQEKALVGAFSVIVQPVVGPMDRFAALLQTHEGEVVITRAKSDSQSQCSERVRVRPTRELSALV